MLIKIPISVGELVDKITILEIKQEKIVDKSKLENINKELVLLITEFEKINELFVGDNENAEIVKFNTLKCDLKLVNKRLWDVEDDIRDCERRENFGEKFIKLARSVYHYNDERSDIKKSFNNLLGSYIVEEKSYAKYND
tara:strand:+ start:1295 stop:1714 length:420 start_codon:yes stop_codon:yes gene_type:complete